MQCSCACIRLVICQSPTLLFLMLCFCQSHRMLFQNIGLKNINLQNFHIIQNKGSPCFISQCLKGSSGTEKNYAPEAELTKVPKQSSLNLQTSYSPFNLVICQMLFICILLLKNSCGFFSFYNLQLAHTSKAEQLTFTCIFYSNTRARKNCTKLERQV